MIQLIDLCKSFGNPPTKVLHNLSLTIRDSEFISLTGRSGSGKTTLLYCMSSLDETTSGEVIIDDKALSKRTEAELHQFRNERMGFVFQFHYLLPELTAIENILMPARKRGVEEHYYDHAMTLLERFNLIDHTHKRPSKLSGGQAQRVAIIRAIVMKPRYLFADEPTGSLDSSNARIIMDIFNHLNQEEGITIVCVTHDEEFATAATRKLILSDGQLING